jgi:flagellar biogenesis protein FliO
MTSGPADQLGSINSQIFQYIEVLLALGGVLVLAYILLRIGLPRVFGIRNTGRGPIEILSRFVLEPKSTLYLVKTGSQVFLIASSEKGISYLTAIAPENVDELLAYQRAADTPAKEVSFMTWLQKTGKNR